MASKRTRIPRGRRPAATAAGQPGQPGLFDTLRERRLSDDACFLCGTVLTAANRSDEHVIPRWAQERFDLWNQQLGLLNRTFIPYRQLTIPCCTPCNTRSLQPLETAMAAATFDGARAVRALGQKVIFTWLGKIFYGLIHRELFLAFNRRDPAEGTIATPELIENFALHHLFLQNARVPMNFVGAFPASMFVYDTLEPPDRRFAWDLRDNLPNLFISLRVGRTGFTAVLQDGGVQEGMRHHLDDFFRVPLHPLQHSELAAQVCYKSMLATHVPKYLVSEGPPGAPITVIQAPVGGLSGSVAFRDWHWRTYGSLLALFMQRPLEDVYDAAADRALTWMRKPDGSLNVLGLETFSMPTADSEPRSRPSAKRRRVSARPRGGPHR